MNSNQNTRHQRSSSRRPAGQYSLAGESSRWWWPTAGAGVAVTVALAAIVATSTPGNAIPIDVDRYASTPVVQAPARSAVAPAQDTPVIPEGWRLCFMWHPNWNPALDGPQPFCREDQPPAGSGDGQARRAAPADQVPGHELTGFSLRQAELAKSVPIP